MTKPWTPARMEAAGIKPLARVPSQWGDVLLGERLAKVWRGNQAVEVVQTFWFLSRAGLEVGRPIEWEHLARLDGSPISQEDRLLVAMKDAATYIPILMRGAEARRQAVYGDFAKKAH